MPQFNTPWGHFIGTIEDYQNYEVEMMRRSGAYKNTEEEPEHEEPVETAEVPQEEPKPKRPAPRKTVKRK